MLTIKFVACRGSNTAIDYEMSPGNDLSVATRKGVHLLDEAKYRGLAGGFHVLRHDMIKERNDGAVINEWYVGDPSRRVAERCMKRVVSRLVNGNVQHGELRTSMRLEPEFWDAAKEICRREANPHGHVGCSGSQEY